jgi:septal ring factor EnvC (AmiA/AmiB activator)
VELLQTDILKLEYLGGLLLVLLGTWFCVRRERWNRETREDPKNRKIRQLLADVKLATRQLEEVEEELDTRRSEFEEAVTTMQELRATLATRDQELATMRSELRDEVRKTRKLREDLTDQAADTHRISFLKR